jgi:hypothetical protein
MIIAQHFSAGCGMIHEMKKPAKRATDAATGSRINRM